MRPIDAGITTVTDLSQVSNTPAHSDALVKGLKDSGIRAIYGYSRGSGPSQKWPDDVERLQKQHFASTDQLVTLALGTAIDKDQWLTARKHGLRIFTHVVGANPGIGPEQVMKLGDEGLMGPDNVYIHFTDATNEQVRRVKDTGGSLSIACPIEMAMRHGMPPIQQALDAGIRPSLSSDVETTMAADMFTQMRSAFTLQRAARSTTLHQGRTESAAAPDCARHDRVRDVAGRARRRPGSARSARSRPAKRPTSSCCAPTSPTCCRSTTPMARS